MTSPDFENEGWMKDANSGYGEDASPELDIAGVDEAAKSLVVTLDDLGHPIRPGYNHWVAWNIPPYGRIPARIPKAARIESPVRMEQGLAYGKHCYRGPKPPFNWKHRYRFTVYALDTLLTLPGDSRKADVLAAMEGHVLQTGQLFGIYQRRHNK